MRDAGFEMIFAGLRQTPEMIAAAGTEEDVDVVGVSMHNGAHLTLAPAVVRSLRDAGLDTPVVVGGIVPEVDMPEMKAGGLPLFSVRGPRTMTSWPRSELLLISRPERLPGRDLPQPAQCVVFHRAALSVYAVKIVSPG